MADNPVLTSAEAAYFSSRGEKSPEEPTAGAPPAAEPDAPEPDPASEPDPGETTPEPTQTDERRVPLAALHESRAKEKAERERREAAEKKYADDMARMEARINQMQAAFQPPAQPAQPSATPLPPDPNTDPVAYVEHIGRMAAEAHAATQRFQEQQRAISQEQQIRSWAGQQEQQFMATAPDYLDAVGFLQKSRAEELAAMGLPEDRIGQTIAMERDALLAHAVQNRLNPAEIAYKVAKQRGFSGKAAAPAQEAPDPVARVETIQRGQQLSTRVPASGASQGTMTAQQLLEMPSHEFDAWIAKHPAQSKRLLGE